MASKTQPAKNEH